MWKEEILGVLVWILLSFGLIYYFGKSEANIKNQLNNITVGDTLVYKDDWGERQAIICSRVWIVENTFSVKKHNLIFPLWNNKEEILFEDDIVFRFIKIKKCKV